MPLPDESTLYIRIWIGQKCVACGTELQYLRRFTVERRDTFYDATVASVEAEYKKHARATAELCPCPHCGWLQPDMVGGARSSRHGLTTFFGVLILLAAVVAAGVGLLPRLIGCCVSAGIAGLTLLIHLSLTRINPNRRREGNRERANQRLADGTLRLVQAGTSTTTPAMPFPLRSLALAAAMLLGSAFAFLAPLTYEATLLFGQIPGVILFVVSGSKFANIALDMKLSALPHQILEVNTTLVTDESVPEDFQKK